VPSFKAIDEVEPAWPPTPPPMAQRLEMRPVLGDPPFSSSPRPVTGGWLRLRDEDRPLDPELITTFCDAWWPPIFATMERLMAVPTLELTVHFRHHIPIHGPVFAQFRTAAVSEGHFDETGQIWAPDGTLLAESRQIALPLPIDPRPARASLEEPRDR
jgi:acyl-CoA thioesterase